MADWRSFAPFDFDLAMHLTQPSAALHHCPQQDSATHRRAGGDDPPLETDEQISLSAQ